jgi:hypothetical protein
VIARLAALGLISATFPGPVFAQDADPANQLVEGYLSCFMGHGDPDVVAPNLGLYGWTHEPAEDGITIAIPGAGDASFVLIADDGSFCHVESLVLGTEKAAEVLALAMPAAGVTLPEATVGADGCTTYDLGAGVTASLTSGGNDPVCTSETDSGVRFDFAADE